MNTLSPHTYIIAISSNKIISHMYWVDYTLEDVDLSNAILVAIPKWVIHLYINLLAELSWIEELIREAYNNDKSIGKIFPLLIEEYRSILRYQYRLYEEVVNNNYDLLHLEKSAYQFMELVTQNFAQHVESALSIFASQVKTEFDNLRNSLDS
jgi:hypothetical protein